jgi:predicted ATPase
MLKSIHLKNWKSFVDEEIPLGALTLLSGQNGAGKSSVIQALLMLRQSYQQKSLSSSSLSLQGELVRLGTVEDIRYEYAEEDEGEIGLTWEGGAASWRFAIPTFPREKLESRYLELDAFPQEADISGLSLFSPASCQFLHAERVGPRVAYAFSDLLVSTQRNLGTQGELTAHFLSLFGDEKVLQEKILHPKEARKELKFQVEAWMDEVCPGTRLNFELHPSLDQIQLRYTFSVQGGTETKKYRATHVGFGITYTLPVLVALLSAKPKDLILLENPEAHLHPRGQRHLGRLIAKAASCGIQIIVESHSDHILNGIRLEVAEGGLPPSDVALHFFERISEDGEIATWIESPVIDHMGRIEPWPKGFFDEITEGLGALLKIESDKRKGKAK